MYRNAPSEPIHDTESGTEFVALPWEHFKASEDFTLTRDGCCVRLYSTRVYPTQRGVSIDSDTAVFGDKSSLGETTPIFAVNDLSLSDPSGNRVDQTGPDRQALWERVQPVFGRMLLRWLDHPAVYVSPSFREDFFKSKAELNAEALEAKIAWAHTYITISQALMAKHSTESVSALRTALGLDPRSGETEDDEMDRIEAAVDAFADDNVMIWSLWAETTVSSLVEDVAECLDLPPRTEDLRHLLFADWLVPGAVVPDDQTYRETRRAALRAGQAT